MTPGSGVVSSRPRLLAPSSHSPRMDRLSVMGAEESDMATESEGLVHLAPPDNHRGS